MSLQESARYDAIGRGYRRVRTSDPRILARVEEALGDAVSVVNVGAGTGSYESPQRKVVAVEPSATMIRQRAPDAAPAIVGVAEALPFLDTSVDAATAFFTLHHWKDQARGLSELRRIARKRVVLLTIVPDAVEAAARSSRWLTGVYFPLIQAADEAMFPRANSGLFEQSLGPCEISTVAVPADCADGFLDAYWARPERYLDPVVRAGISGFQLLPRDALDEGLSRLERDLRDGSWDARFGHLRAARELDAGLRLIVARLDPPRVA